MKGKAVNTFEPPHDKTNKMAVSSVNTQISLGICPVWSESLLCAQYVAKDPSFLHVDSEDSDQSGWTPDWPESSLGAHAILFVLSWGGSFISFFQNSFILTGKESIICPSINNENKSKGVVLHLSGQRSRSDVKVKNIHSVFNLTVYMSTRTCIPYKNTILTIALTVC